MTRFSSARLLLPILGSLLFALPASAESIQLSQQGRLADGDGAQGDTRLRLAGAIDGE